LRGDEVIHGLARELPPPLAASPCITSDHLYLDVKHPSLKMTNRGYRLAALFFFILGLGFILYAIADARDS
jgi:hypothetical protein